MTTAEFLQQQYAHIPADILQRASRIKLLCLDVDGVMTAGNLHFADQGEQLKSFNILDGLGIKQFMHTGGQVAVITGRKSAMVAHRCDKLGIKNIYQGQEDKIAVLADLLASTGYSVDQLAHVGDDLPDLPIIRRAQLGFAVANAHPFVAHHAHWQTEKAGGQGAVREVTDLLLYAQDQLAAALDGYLSL